MRAVLALPSKRTPAIEPQARMWYGSESGRNGGLSAMASNWVFQFLFSMARIGQAKDADTRRTFLQHFEPCVHCNVKLQIDGIATGAAVLGTQSKQNVRRLRGVIVLISFVEYFIRPISKWSTRASVNRE